MAFRFISLIDWEKGVLLPGQNVKISPIFIHENLVKNIVTDIQGIGLQDDLEIFSSR